MPCWPGEGAAQVSWLSGFGHVPLAQVSSWSRQAREVPRPCKDNRFPTRAPRGPSIKSAAPRPASSGTPGTIHHLPRETEKAGTGARRAAARGFPPGPDPRGKAPGPGRGSPAPAFRSGGGPGPEAEGASAAAQPERPAQERPEGPRHPCSPSPHGRRRRRPPEHPCARPPPGVARSRRAAAPDQQPQRAGPSFDLQPFQIDPSLETE